MRVSALVWFLGSYDPQHGKASAKHLTAALALGPWSLFLGCPLLWRRFLSGLLLWRLPLWCLFVAPSAACYAPPAARSLGPYELCAAPSAASYVRRADPDVVVHHRCGAPDLVPRYQVAGLGVGLDVDLGVGPGAAPRQAFEPRHPTLLAPRLAFPCQTPRLLPKFQTSFDARSFSLQFSCSCSTSLVAQILPARSDGGPCP